MKIQQIRNSTMRITYADHLFITDPCLAPKHSIESWGNVSLNPVVELPGEPAEITAGLDMAVISHMHQDHFDPMAEKFLPKDLPLFCQPEDEAKLQEKGFQSVTPVQDPVQWRGITMTRTSGRHGTGVWEKQLAPVSGFVFQAENEPTVYWAGDTIWCDKVQRVLEEIQPDIILTHSSGAILDDGGPIVMDAEQTIAVCRAAPRAVVVATHMEAFDHGTVSRADLRALARENEIPSSRLFIPADGETIEL
ncbi:MAG: MBL fold metallo-hydrolase [Desulfobacterales bacterium]|nr:MBL fold metallo-hydrolase [Desulfobacterales bacterium]